jgi:hypothetical protein
VHRDVVGRAGERVRAGGEAEIAARGRGDVRAVADAVLENEIDQREVVDDLLVATRCRRLDAEAGRRRVAAEHLVLPLDAGVDYRHVDPLPLEPFPRLVEAGQLLDRAVDLRRADVRDARVERGVEDLVGVDLLHFRHRLDRGDRAVVDDERDAVEHERVAVVDANAADGLPAGLEGDSAGAEAVEQAVLRGGKGGAVCLDRIVGHRRAVRARSRGGHRGRLVVQLDDDLGAGGRGGRCEEDEREDEEDSGYCVLLHALSIHVSFGSRFSSLGESRLGLRMTIGGLGETRVRGVARTKTVFRGGGWQRRRFLRSRRWRIRPDCAFVESLRPPAAAGAVRVWW